MKKLFFFVATSALLLASCALPQTTTSTHSKTRTAKHLDVYGNGVIYRPVIADLEVNPTKVSATVEEKRGNVDILKKAAVAKAIDASNADILVEPNYIIENTDGLVKVTVKGYPAVYKNFKTIQESDIELLSAGTAQVQDADEGGQSSSTTTTTAPPKKKMFGLF